MKKSILLFIFILCFLFAPAKNKKHNGYLVYVKIENNTGKVSRVKTIEEVYGKIPYQFKNTEIVLEEVLKKSHYVQLIMEHCEYYVERVIIIEKKNGKLKSKRILK